jgi:hypothetical protein
MSEFVDDVQEIVAEATSPKTFDIMNVIKGRSYPSTEVNAYLDELLAYEAFNISFEIDEANGKDADDSRIKKLQKQLDELLVKLDESKYVFKISGISEGDREDLLNIAVTKYPMEYSETKNPFTNENERTEIENKDRDRYFTNLLWQAQIKQITAPDGSVQENLTLDNIVELRRSLPIAATASINEAVEKVRVATAVFMAKVNEDFLQKR